MFFIHVLYFFVMVIISAQNSSALLCYCGEKDVIGNNCKVINGQLTMTCREDQNVCMNMETLGDNHTLEGIAGYVYQGCWKSPTFIPKVACSDRAKQIKLAKIVKFDWPSWICYCDTDMCNRDPPIASAENESRKHGTNSVVILLMLIFVIVGGN